MWALCAHVVFMVKVVVLRSLIGKEGAGMSDLLFNTIQEAAIDLRPQVTVAQSCSRLCCHLHLLLLAAVQVHHAVRGFYHVPWVANALRNRYT